ncbi:MAG: hypothetical protein ACTSRZ_19890, partial [Promethearchaeota archaeon]
FENIEKKDAKNIKNPEMQHAKSCCLRTIKGEYIDIEPTIEEAQIAKNLLEIFKQKAKCNYGFLIGGFIQDICIRKNYQHA